MHYESQTEGRTTHMTESAQHYHNKWKHTPKVDYDEQTLGFAGKLLQRIEKEIQTQRSRLNPYLRLTPDQWANEVQEPAVQSYRLQSYRAELIRNYLQLRQTADMQTRIDAASRALAAERKRLHIMEGSAPYRFAITMKSLYGLPRKIWRRLRGRE